MGSRPPLALLLAALAGCAPAYLARTERLASGEGRVVESYDFHEAKLSRADGGGWVVELSRGDYRGFRFLILPPIHDVAGVRVHVPPDVEEREYAIGDACTVEFRRHTSFGLWSPLGPGTLVVTRWNPKGAYLAVRLRVVQERGDGSTDIWIGNFAARP